MQRQALSGQEALEPEIGHDRRHDAIPGQPPGLSPILPDQAKNLVAIDDLAPLVGQQQPVGVAVERQAEVGAVLQHFGA